MKVTEHNITDWQLDEKEIESLIHLTKLEIKRCEGDSFTQTYYGIILGKLIILLNDIQQSPSRN
jgi:Asp-tRNA(Asn)/Glu-tRNA(Gln) amidotransferase C subunit